MSGRGRRRTEREELHVAAWRIADKFASLPTQRRVELAALIEDELNRVAETAARDARRIAGASGASDH